MNENSDKQSIADAYILKIRNFLVVGFSVYLFSWCIARLIDRSEYMIGRAENFESLDSIALYKTVMFSVVPITVGIIAASFVRPKNIYLPTYMLALSIVAFLVIG